MANAVMLAQLDALGTEDVHNDAQRLKRAEVCHCPVSAAAGNFSKVFEDFINFLMIIKSARSGNAFTKEGIVRAEFLFSFVRCIS